METDELIDFLYSFDFTCKSGNYIKAHNRAVGKGGVREGRQSSAPFPGAKCFFPRKIGKQT